VRISEGTAGRVDERVLVETVLEKMGQRRYGKEQLAWLSWLLRFVLPMDSDSQEKFRGCPNAQSPAGDGTYGPWNHIVIDEAQDLSAAEASLIGSLVEREGALTVSADFKQIVSPVHAIENPKAFRIGSSLFTVEQNLTYNFSVNMRQTKEITDFLRAFYQKNFHESPPFQSNQEFHDSKPELHIMKEANFAQGISQRWNVLMRAGRQWSIAVLQINEDEEQLASLRARLEALNVKLAPPWAVAQTPGHLLTTSVERAKGLEFDVGFVIGLDGSGHSGLHYMLNRAYVALSRPARRLSMFCSDFPATLQGIDKALYSVYKE